jgi:serine/threonine protein kinase
LTTFHAQLKIGSILENRYHIISRLGEGGMGTVFLANDLKLNGKQWAIKESLLHSHHAQGFADEAAILIKLDHPFLPKIIDFFPPDPKGYSYLVIDYIKGHSLQKIFESKKSISIELVVHYAKQLCQVFDYLHHFKPKAIIYRDLKPSNVMVDEQNNIRLIDFGIARNYTSERDSDTVQLGTVGFAAPEQYEHQQTDARTDLYTLGALLFYLLMDGQYYTHQIAQNHQLTLKLPEKLVLIMTKLLKKNPEERFQTATEAFSELEQVFLEKPMPINQPELIYQDSVQMTRKLIIVGSLYAGAGSTFVAMSLAKALNHFAVPHALVENICNQPELFTMLNGERHAPQNYIFSAEKVFRESIEQTPSWCNGHSEWHPLPPSGFDHNWQKEQSYKLLYSIKKPIVIIDVSHHWEDPVVVELCRQADEIVAVAGPSLTRLNMPSTLNDVKQLSNNQLEGKSIRCITNRTALFSAQKEWFTALPFAPICSLPEFDYAEVLQAQWAGRLFQDQEQSLQILTEQLKPLLKKVIPPSFFRHVKPLKKNVLTRWFK